MPLLLYLVVLLISVSSVLFEMRWLAAPEPQYKAPPVQVASRASPAAKANANARLRPVYPTLPAPPQAPPARPAVTSAPPPAAATTSVAAAGTTQTEAAATPAPAAPPPACDIQACAAAYYSFRASDCTYQPYDGPRRLCTKGTPPAQTQAKPGANAAPSGIDARAQAPTCNVTACAAAYRTFDPADCTYQPLQGPRRLCTKGMPPAQTQAKPGANAAPSGIDARAQAPTCNVTACAAAYRTFDPADCTYQPLQGPRRLCAK